MHYLGCQPLNTSNLITQTKLSLVFLNLIILLAKFSQIDEYSYVEKHGKIKIYSIS